jgi:hypothetical protein
MIGLAIEILWFIIGVIILGGVVYIALYVLHQVFANLPPIIDRVVWGVFGILCLIYVLMLITGQAPSFRPRLTGSAGSALAAWRARYLPDLRGVKA